MAGIETDLTLSNRYQLIRRIRVGTAGDVWEARDQRSADRVIDIEIFRHDPPGDPGFVERRRRGMEWLLWPWFLHPGAPRILQFGEEGSIRFVVLEHLEGESLAERLGRGGPMKPAHAARTAAELAEAIQKAHDIGFVHGALRPENILITREGPKVLELGFTPAAWEGATLPDSENQRAEDPERPQEPGPKPRINEESRRADLYALGVVLYHMLTGRPPAFPSDVGGSEGEFLPVHLVAPWVPTDLAEVCEAVVSADPRVRPPTAAALASVLRRHAADPLVPERNTGGDAETILVVEDAAAPSVEILEEELAPTPKESRGSIRSAAKTARRAAHAERAAQKERATAERAAKKEAAQVAKAREREEQARREAEERIVREERARSEAEERARHEAEEAGRVEAKRRAAEEAARVEAERWEAEESARLLAEEAVRQEAEEAGRAEAERRAAEEAARLQAEEHARQKALERARLEAVRLAAEADEAFHHEDRRIEAELRAVAMGAVETMPGRAAQKELRRKAKQVAKADRKSKKGLLRKAKS